jgi:hypothetical protein
LSYQLKVEGIKSNSIKVKAIKKMKIGKYFQKKIRTDFLLSKIHKKNYFQSTELLNAKLQKNNITKWRLKCQQTFEKLKKKY